MEQEFTTAILQNSQMSNIMPLEIVENMAFHVRLL